MNRVLSLVSKPVFTIIKEYEATIKGTDVAKIVFKKGDKFVFGYYNKSAN